LFTPVAGKTGAVSWQGGLARSAGLQGSRRVRGRQRVIGVARPPDARVPARTGETPSPGAPAVVEVEGSGACGGGSRRPLSGLAWSGSRVRPGGWIGVAPEASVWRGRARWGISRPVVS